ncbi:SDR family oxidoreductase [Kushneria marisflavi]|uniref:Short-chain dehydrogenase n=1 Tax=Kushneria marisflavi TaxID=157779 RepID=A0A240UQB1_9GAMM|nr:SDR family oxidoreductase [Kushneria marisflavi]ART63210.1 short-chain dehydrogenase [Kushneria marisflavi]RKD84234.1 NAD(P)-dependent dehydrogenase (short-subunit alcohol dehydrogenase family) [Kushneria marisflavi]
MRLQGQRAVVTGAASCIGLTTAECFLTEGASVALLDQDDAALARTGDRLARTYPGRVHVETVDVADNDAVRTALAGVLDALGGVDILINAAGINVFADPLAVNAELWQRCMSINLEGAWHCIQALLPSMLSQSRGHVVNIASVHGHRIIPGAFPYPVAKHGLIGLTRSLGIEYAARGIRVNSISPGLIKTPSAQAWLDGLSEAERQQQVELLPCKRFGEASEVAATALFLAGDEARFINATDILIDGGRSQVYHL